MAAPQADVVADWDTVGLILPLAPPVRHLPLGPDGTVALADLELLLADALSLAADDRVDLAEDHLFLLQEQTEGPAPAAADSLWSDHRLSLARRTALLAGILAEQAAYAGEPADADSLLTAGYGRLDRFAYPDSLVPATGTDLPPIMADLLKVDNQAVRHWEKYFTRPRAQAFPGLAGPQGGGRFADHRHAGRGRTAGRTDLPRPDRERAEPAGRVHRGRGRPLAVHGGHRPQLRPAHQLVDRRAARHGDVDPGRGRLPAGPVRPVRRLGPGAGGLQHRRGAHRPQDPPARPRQLLGHAPARARRPPTSPSSSPRRASARIPRPTASRGPPPGPWPTTSCRSTTPPTSS